MVQEKELKDASIYIEPGLLTSDGATPPVDVTDAFMVNVTPRGTPERTAYIVNNTPFTAMLRNTGTGNLTTVTVNVEPGWIKCSTYCISISTCSRRRYNIKPGSYSGAPGFHTLTVYTSAPNGTTDTFLNNDTLLSFIFIQPGAITATFYRRFYFNHFSSCRLADLEPKWG